MGMPIFWTRPLNAILHQFGGLHKLWDTPSFTLQISCLLKHGDRCGVVPVALLLHDKTDIAVRADGFFPVFTDAPKSLLIDIEQQNVFVLQMRWYRQAHLDLAAFEITQGLIIDLYCYLKQLAVSAEDSLRRLLCCGQACIVLDDNLDSIALRFIGDPVDFPVFSFFSFVWATLCKGQHFFTAAPADSRFLRSHPSSL